MARLSTPRTKIKFLWNEKDRVVATKRVARSSARRVIAAIERKGGRILSQQDE